MIKRTTKIAGPKKGLAIFFAYQECTTLCSNDVALLLIVHFVLYQL